MPTVQPPTSTGANYSNAPVTSSTGGLNVGGGTTPTVTPVGPSVISPGEAFSPWYLSQVETNQISLGSLASLFPSAGTKPMSIGQALADFQHMSSSQQAQIESLLYQGGFYVNADGTPMTANFQFGVNNAQAFDALINALATASNQGLPLDQVIQNNITSGAGANNRSSTPGQVIGGGNPYQITLTSP